METILSNDKLTITKDRQLYELEFKYPAYEIINSLLKTRIIRDGITDDSYKTIKFKATSVKTLEHLLQAGAIQRVLLGWDLVYPE